MSNYDMRFARYCLICSLSSLICPTVYNFSRTQYNFLNFSLPAFDLSFVIVFSLVPISLSLSLSQPHQSDLQVSRLTHKLIQDSSQASSTATKTSVEN